MKLASFGIKKKSIKKFAKNEYNCTFRGARKHVLKRCCISASLGRYMRACMRVLPSVRVAYYACTRPSHANSITVVLCSSRGAEREREREVRNDTGKSRAGILSPLNSRRRRPGTIYFYNADILYTAANFPSNACVCVFTRSRVYISARERELNRSSREIPAIFGRKYCIQV